MEKKKPNYYAHEALDRTHVVRDQVYEYLLSHYYIQQSKNKKIRKKIEKAAKLLGEAYQMIGVKHLG